MIKIIQKTTRDFALNLAQGVEYTCDCGSHDIISGSFKIDSENNLEEPLECPDCGKEITN